MWRDCEPWAMSWPYLILEETKCRLCGEIFQEEQTIIATTIDSYKITKDFLVVSMDNPEVRPDKQIVHKECAEIALDAIGNLVKMEKSREKLEAALNLKKQQKEI